MKTPGRLDLLPRDGFPGRRRDPADDHVGISDIFRQADSQLSDNSLLATAHVWYTVDEKEAYV